ncbi:MBL fold metallo-hydrolase [Gottfriedia luciferensis]|uniref:MBL fold metallo-hydrolase n=1 Tax=Gottfriedia luciferensis TaxID=178774 RepID=UPI000B44994C|nr:MBL fold metallo-hydrolase [Gottfriedia luciferensis]
MKVTVIGFWGGYPGKGEATSCYLFKSKNFNLLVDCGSGALASLQNFIDLKSINAVIISHYHHDHIADIGVLQYYKLVNSGIEKFALPIYGHNLDTEKFQTLTYKEATKGYEYDPNETLNLGPFTIRFMKTVHPVDCFAMRIETSSHSVVYTADSSYTEDFVQFAANADLLISDCNMYENQDGKKVGHMSSKDAATIASHAEVKELLLSHLPHSGDTKHLISEAEKYYNGQVHLAYTGFVWKS